MRRRALDTELEGRRIGLFRVHAEGVFQQVIPTVAIKVCFRRGDRTVGVGHAGGCERFSEAAR